MIDWKKYIVPGKFISHSGLELENKYEFNLLLEPENKNDLMKIVLMLEGLAYPFQVIGIRTMGWEIARLLRTIDFMEFPTEFSTSYMLFDLDYIVFDDVITTGNSIKEVLINNKRCPRYIVCIINRSELKKINGLKIYEIRDVLGGK